MLSRHFSRIITPRAKVEDLRNSGEYLAHGPAEAEAEHRAVQALASEYPFTLRAATRLG